MTSGSPEARPRDARGSVPWLWVSVAAVVATAAWVLPVVVSRGHGFDVSDEGSYVLSYRWWDSDARNFNGAQYLYGPVFEALGHSVPALRIARLASVLVAHALFGWAFMSWLAVRFPSAGTRHAVLAGTLGVVAVGGVTYGWLPLSPGYNDVVALGCLAVMAVFFRTWRSVLGTGRLPTLPALVLPLPVLAMVLGKWSSAVVALFFLFVVFVVVAWALRPSGWLRYIGAGVLGTVVVVTAFDLLVASLSDVVPPMVEVNRLAAGSSHTGGKLLSLYADGAQEILGRTIGLVLLIAVVGLVAGLLHRAGRRGPARWVVCAGPVAVLVLLAAVGDRPWPEGGSSGLENYSSALVALVLAAAVVLAVCFVRGRRGDGPPRRRGSVELVTVLAMLLLLPVVQAVGSGNSLTNLAVNVAASWFAFIVLGVAIAGAGSRTRWFLVAAAAATLVLAVSVGADGVLLHPYRTTAYDAADRTLGGTGTLASLAMGATERHELEAVRRAMAPDPPGRRPVIVLDEIAGLVLLTEGRPLGETWTSALAPDRLAASIRASCRDQEWTQEDEPVVLGWRRVPAMVTEALAGCGVRLDGGSYDLVRLPVDERTVSVWTPKK
jgi:hypothetical protein